jgi:hypothetical protein
MSADNNSPSDTPAPPDTPQGAAAHLLSEDLHGPGGAGGRLAKRGGKGLGAAHDVVCGGTGRRGQGARLGWQPVRGGWRRAGDSWLWAVWAGIGLALGRRLAHG